MRPPEAPVSSDIAARHMSAIVCAAVGHPVLGLFGVEVGVPARGVALQRVAEDVLPDAAVTIVGWVGSRGSTIASFDAARRG
jgi:hypothetical protein